MSIVEAREKLPALDLETFDNTNWLVTRSEYKGDDATYYFRVSHDKKQRIDGVFIRSTRTVLGTKPISNTTKSYTDALDLRTWCKSERPKQLRAEVSRVVGGFPSRETGWIKEKIPDNQVMREKKAEMCNNRFGLSIFNDPWVKRAKVECQGTGAERQSLTMSAIGTAKETVTAKIEYRLMCIDQTQGPGYKLLSVCETTCTTEFGLFL